MADQNPSQSQSVAAVLEGPSTLVDAKGKTIAAKVAFPYGDCELSRPDSANVYDNRGGKSTVALNVKVAILPIGAIVAATVYARLDTTSGKPKFDVALPKGIVMKDDARDVFRGHVNKAVMAWMGRERAFSEAWARLTSAPKPKGTKSTDLEWTPPAATKGEPLDQTA